MRYPYIRVSSLGHSSYQFKEQHSDFLNTENRKNSCSFPPRVGRVFDSGSQVCLPIADGRVSVSVCFTLKWQAAHTFLRRGLGVLRCVLEKASVQSFIFWVWAIQFNYTHATSLIFIITLIHFNIPFPWLSIEKRFIYYLNSFIFMMPY